MLLDLVLSDILKGVSTVEEFAYIWADIVRDAESASGVFIHELGDVKDQVIQKN